MQEIWLEPAEKGREGTMSRLRKMIGCIILLSVMCVAAGCHTMKGAGQDIEQGGKDIQKAADKNMN